MIRINMLSKADTVKGHGVLTAHDEQVALVREELSDSFEVVENSRKSCDIYHFHTINLQYFLRLPLIRRSGITVGYVHFLPETLEKSLCLPRGIREQVYRYVIRFYKSMDYLVTVNPSFVDKLCAYGIPREKIAYIPNFVSPQRFYKIEGMDKNAVKAQYGIAPDRFTVLSVGQLQKRKGVLEFIELAKQMPQVEFVWAGGFSFGKMSDGYEDIRTAMETPPANVKFIGMVERSEMNALYNMADVMFQPSFEELFPMTILEAMSCGLPMVLRDLPEYRPILQGYYLKGSNTGEFKASIESLRQPRLHHTASLMSQKGSAFYSRDRIKELWRQYYCTVYSRGREKGRIQLPHLRGLLGGQKG
ncbi:MAG: glycosyltransferase family 4 protein [Angelakisella sp.]